MPFTKNIHEIGYDKIIKWIFSFHSHVSRFAVVKQKLRSLRRTFDGLFILVEFEVTRGRVISIETTRSKSHDRHERVSQVADDVRRRLLPFLFIDVLNDVLVIEDVLVEDVFVAAAFF